MTRSTWKTLTVLLWLLALALATWTLWQLPLDNIGPQLDLLSWQNWLSWLTVNIAIFYLVVKRWQVLGHALNIHLSLSQLFRLRQAGSTVSFLTPGPHFGGEPLQLYWLCKYFQLSLHRAVAMLGLDRFMETGTNIAVLLTGVFILLGTTLLPVGDGVQISVILAVVLVVMLGLGKLVLRHPAWLAKRIGSLERSWRGPRLETPTESDSSGPDQSGWLKLVDLLRSAVSGQRRSLWLALLLSLLGWLALLAELSLLLYLLGLKPSWLDIILIMVGMRLAMLMPVPGGIGTVEASVLWSFTILGLPVSAAAGLIALIRLRDVLVLLLGLGCLASFRNSAAQRINP